MIDQYIIQWTQEAENDLNDIVLFIAEDSSERAHRIGTEIEEKVRKLANFSDRGRYVPEFRDIGITIYREIIYKPWRIIYKVDKNIIFINAVLDARRNLESLLLERLIR
ncbi:MAG: type II toxin-antitoxin system RelE/ParE family toxin [Desulfobacterales bacterium]|nr:type II toxin-antitoxin system RelE/ParE family toxin [Desulfobacterales bacterium]